MAHIFPFPRSGFRVMRRQLLKLKQGRSTKAERRFAEILKKNHIPFRAKVIVNNREIDFLIGKYAIDIDGHKQDSSKNESLFNTGLVPIHISNKELQNDEFNTFTKWLIRHSSYRGRTA
jgi:DNA polymerase II small subunit/DNA polymerase delta subunit B